MREAVDPLVAWARSGAMWLTGRADGPPLAIGAPVAAAVEQMGHRFEELSVATGRPVTLDWGALLAERAAVAGFTRNGSMSAGGTCRLLPTADGWIAANLARSSDIELVPAWLGIDAVDSEDPWAPVAEAVAAALTVAVVDQGKLLGIPVAAVPMSTTAIATDEQFRVRHQTLPPAPFLVQRVAPKRARRSTCPVVVDFSSLWAGPLCAHLLGLAGARVIKVESSRRPDGARFGPPAFYDLLHAGHESVAFDFNDDRELDAMRRLVAAADVVIEASRPRAFAQLGLDPSVTIGANPHLTWITITGYGRTGPWSNRTAFGDDAAAAAGLVAWDERGPVFCADAVADPVSGIVAATAALAAMADGGGQMIDVALREAAASCVGPVEEGITTGDEVIVARPRARVATAPAASMGSHTEAVLADFGIRR